MRSITYVVLFIVGLSPWAPASGQSPLRYHVSLNFPAFGLPGYRLQENFKNLGLSAGITYPLNAAETSGIRLDLGRWHTRSQGRSIYLQGQFSWHPRIGDLETGLDIGLGYQLNRGPGPAWRPGTEGQWIKQPNQQGLFFVPAGLHLGYRVAQHWRPFVQYQAQVLLGYNEGFPFFPLHLFSIGQTFTF